MARGSGHPRQVNGCHSPVHHWARVSVRCMQHHPTRPGPRIQQQDSRRSVRRPENPSGYDLVLDIDTDDKKELPALRSALTVVQS